MVAAGRASEIKPDDASRSRKRNARARTAGVLILVAVASLAIGLALRVHQFLGRDAWRSRIVRGEPVVVRFFCGVHAVVDCNVSVRITYQRRDSAWCENLQRSDQGEVFKTHWCNGNPEQGTVSIFGVLHTFDRFGAVRVDDKLVGQLLLE